MKVVIFAGGIGSRMGLDTVTVPKPMLNVGREPLIWHVMQRFAFYGFNDFVICLGFRGEVIKDYFMNFHNYKSDIEVNLGTGEIKKLVSTETDWRVTLVDTGNETYTAGRLRQIKRFVGQESFFLTYGDGVSDVNLTSELEFHKLHGKKATVLAVPAPSRFGELKISQSVSSQVSEFAEKPVAGQHLINGGYFILNHEVFDLAMDDSESWEEGPLQNLASEGELMAYEHHGFWRPCDTPSDRQLLENLYLSGKAPWLAYD